MINFKYEPNFLIIYLQDQKAGYINYEKKEKNLIIFKVFVNEEHRNLGIANKLMQEIYNFAKNNNLTIVPICSYSKKWLEKQQ